MDNTKTQIEVNYPPVASPETVQELIDLLAIFPKDHKVSFAPFTLYRLKDRGKRVHFEMNETIDTIRDSRKGDAG